MRETDTRSVAAEGRPRSESPLMLRIQRGCVSLQIALARCESQHSIENPHEAGEMLVTGDGRVDAMPDEAGEQSCPGLVTEQPVVPQQFESPEFSLDPLSSG